MPKHSHVLYDAPMPPPYAHSRIRRVPATATNAKTTSRARRIVDHSCPQIRRLLCDSVPRRDTTLGRLGAVRSAGVLFLAVALFSAALAPAALAATPGPDRLPRRALWIEVSANLRMLASRETIRALVERARASGIDTLIPEAKNAWGFVIYESAFAPHIRTSPVPRPGYPPPGRVLEASRSSSRPLLPGRSRSSIRRIPRPSSTSWRCYGRSSRATMST